MGDGDDWLHGNWGGCLPTPSKIVSASRTVLIAAEITPLRGRGRGTENPGFHDCTDECHAIAAAETNRVRTKRVGSDRQRCGV